MSMNYKLLAKETLGKKRYTHSVNVADACVKLAKKHGVDIEKAYTAGILHDIMKEHPQDELKTMVEQSGLSPSRLELATPPLWHAIAGACYVRDKLGINDGDIINSIRFHTIARSGMSNLEKIVYLSDLISEERVHSEVDKHREYAFYDLDCAMYCSLKWAIGKTLSQNAQISHYTFEAYNFYNKFWEEKNKNDG